MEMAEALGIDPAGMEMDEFCHRIRQAFLPELQFLADLPHVLVSPDRIYAHAAIMDEEHFGSDFREVMTTPFFLHTDKQFSKPVVVGHMPVSEYRNRVIDFSPVFDPARNIWSIDGGNVVKKSGQLNAVIFQGRNVTTVSADDLEQAVVLKDTDPGVQIPFAMSWNHRDISVLDHAGEQSLVHSDWLRRSFWVPDAFVQSGSVSEYTNYRMPAQAGERVSVVLRCQGQVLVKHNSILGWMEAEALALPESEDNDTEQEPDGM